MSRNIRGFIQRQMCTSLQYKIILSAQIVREEYNNNENTCNSKLQVND